MTKLLPVKPFLAVMAALGVALVLACGGGAKTQSVGSLLQLLPQNADSFTFGDLEQLRDERFDSLEEQLASFIGERRLDDWGIDLDDVGSLVISEPNSGHALIILRGQFVVEDVEEALDDEGLRDSDHRGATIWSERRGGGALAFAGEDVIVIGEEERVEESIDVFIDDARSMDQDDDGRAVVDALEDALVYSVAADCGHRGCLKQGSAVLVEARDLIAVFAFLFRDDDAAADAEGDIENDLDELVEDSRTEVEGELVIAESLVEREQVALDRDGTLAFRLEEQSQAVARRPGDDHGDDRRGATSIRVGDWLEGDIGNIDDRDFFAFSPERGSWYRVEAHLRSNPDTVLFVHGPQNDFLYEDDDSGDDGGSRLEWQAVSDTYYLEVTGFGDATGTYLLSLEKIAEARPAPATTTPVPTSAPAQTAAPETPISEPEPVEAAAAAPVPTPEPVETAAAAPVPTPEPAETQAPAIDIDEMRAAVAEALAQVTTAGLSAREIQSLVDEALSQAAATGLTAEDLEELVRRAVEEARDPVPAQTAAPVPTPEPTSVPARVGNRYGGELRLALAEEPFVNGFSLRDKRSSGARQIYSLIFSRLWRVGSAGTEVDLARHWEVSADGRTWTIALREALFHDGRPLIAHDVEYSILAWHELGFLEQELPKVTVIDDYTLQLEFEEPALGSRFLGNSVPIVPRGMFDEPIDNFTDLVGSGPFIPSVYRANSYLTLIRNPDYYESELPYVDAVTLFVVPAEMSTLLAVFLSEQVHFLGYPRAPDGGPLEHLLWGEIRSQISLNSPHAAFGQYPVVYGLWFDTENEPFNDMRMRLAVKHAIDQELIIDFLALGELQGVVPKALFPESTVRLNEPVLVEGANSYDPVMARELLAAAGYPDGFATTLHVPDGLGSYFRVLAPMLGDVGINVTRVESESPGPAVTPGLRLALLLAPTRDIYDFYNDYFTEGGVYNYSRTDLPKIASHGDLDAKFAEIAEQVYYIPLWAPLYARLGVVRGPLPVETTDLGTTLKRLWLEP